MRRSSSDRLGHAGTVVVLLAVALFALPLIPSGTDARSMRAAPTTTASMALPPAVEPAAAGVTSDGITAGGEAAAPVASSGSTILFQEQGLPPGTSWTVATWAYEIAGDLPTVASTTASSQSVGAATSAYTDFDVATVPGALAGSVWVGSADLAPPLDPTLDTTVNVTFVQVSTASFSVTLHLSTVGFPQDARWAVQLGAQGYGYANSTAAQSVPGGTDVPVIPSTLAFPNATEFVPTEVDVLEFDDSPTWSNMTVSGPVLPMVDTSEPSCIIFHYAMKFRVSVSATTGGSATPATAWVVPGTPVNLHASAVSGYYFVNWSGVGPGSVNATTPDLVVTALGPMWMLALFAPVYYTVNVTATGVPVSESFQVLFNSAFYTSQNGSITIPLVLAGYYSVAAPFDYSNLSPSIRYVAQHIASSVPAENNGTYHLTGNASFVLDFVPQYSLVLTTVGPGAATPFPGAYWITSGSSVAIVGIPDSGYTLTSWVGTGLGSYTGSLRTFSLSMLGPVTETATFGDALGVPTFQVQLVALGLAPGTEWDAALGPSGGHGGSSTIVLASVPFGSYTLAIPSLYVTPWHRWLAGSPAGTTVSVAANTTLTVNFTEQYAVTVAAGPGGTVGSVLPWLPAGSFAPLSATPSTGYSFAGWSGSWPSSSPEWQLVVNGSLNETATFAPLPTPPAKIPPLLVAAAVGSVVLVVGVIVGYRFVRLGTLPGRRS